MSRSLLKGKVIVITGASSGIGLEMAKQLDAQGAVTVLTARSENRLKEAALALKGEHGVFVLDVASTEQVFDTMEQIVKRYGKIDILINNAGFGVFERFIDAPLEHFEEMMEVNYMGTVRCTKAALPYMLQAGSGHIVNVASLAGKIGSAKATAYSATKHAVLGFTNCLRHELKGTGVFVTAINPGPIDTPFFLRADPSGTYVKNVEWLMLKPETVAKEVVRAIVRRKAEVNIPRIASAGVKLLQLFPRTLDKVAYRLLSQK